MTRVTIPGLRKEKTLLQHRYKQTPTQYLADSILTINREINQRLMAKFRREGRIL